MPLHRIPRHRKRNHGRERPNCRRCGVGGNPAGWLINSRDGTPMQEPKRPVLAHGKVRHVGDAYAAVVAETLEQALDAVEAIEADIDEQDAVIDMASALANDKTLVHDEIATNLCFDWGWIEDNRAATDAAIRRRLWLQNLSLRRRGIGSSGGKETQPPRQMDIDPHRGVLIGCPWA